MSVRTFSIAFGIVFLLAGLSGFVPGLSPEHDHGNLTIPAGSRLALGLFPVNVVHNVVHLAFGIWGLVAARTAVNSTIYARSVAVIYAVLTVLGANTVTNTAFGLVPIYGNDVWLHAALAAVAGYFGFLRKRETWRHSPA